MKILAVCVVTIRLDLSLSTGRAWEDLRPGAHPVAPAIIQMQAFRGPVSNRETIRDPSERRARRRFQIGQDVCYICLSGSRVDDEGVGKIVNVSSSGVRFTTEHTLNVGKRVEVTVEWPALIDDKCLMNLVIKGWVARSDSNSAAVKIEHYEFRTRASKAVPGFGQAARPGAGQQEQGHAEVWQHANHYLK